MGKQERKTKDYNQSDSLIGTDCFLRNECVNCYFFLSHGYYLSQINSMKHTKMH